MRMDGARRLGQVYALHKQELFTYALSITRSPAGAEDAVHEAFRRLLECARLPEDLRPYAFRCVRNASIDTLRRARREQEAVEDWRVLFDEAISPQVRENAATLLSALADEEREIVVLKLFTGLTFREIAEVCNAPQGTVAASYWRSLNKLRECHAEQPHEQRVTR